MTLTTPTQLDGSIPSVNNNGTDHPQNNLTAQPQSTQMAQNNALLVFQKPASAKAVRGTQMLYKNYGTQLTQNDLNALSIYHGQNVGNLVDSRTAKSVSIGKQIKSSTSQKKALVAAGKTIGTGVAVGLTVGATAGAGVGAAPGAIAGLVTGSIVAAADTIRIFMNKRKGAKQEMNNQLAFINQQRVLHAQIQQMQQGGQQINQLPPVNPPTGQNQYTIQRSDVPYTNVNSETSYSIDQQRTLPVQRQQIQQIEQQLGQPSSSNSNLQLKQKVVSARHKTPPNEVFSSVSDDLSTLSPGLGINIPKESETTSFTTPLNDDKADNSLATLTKNITQLL